ncbi:DNA-directed DNA polymerase [Salinibaculum rarum]|uniref:DNA-directed DNA polymerase n=1 Tax=Salinibaculum rarum TaxID=3058903 RepID=UPI00265D7322|nr:DNA-directed DNA polymerase [Salinibaculum sp. KK48]
MTESVSSSSPLPAEAQKAAQKVEQHNEENDNGEEVRPENEAAAVVGNNSNDVPVRSESSENVDNHNSTDKGNNDNDELEYDVDDDDVDEEIDIAVMQISYDTKFLDNDTQRPVLHVFGQTEDGELEHVEVHGFKPYFYVPIDERDEVEAESCVRGTERVWDESKEQFETIRGEEVVRVYTEVPRNVGQIRDDYEHYEADVLFPNRFLIDKDISSGVRVPKNRQNDDTIKVKAENVEPVELTKQPRVHMMDIEVDDRYGFPEPEDAEQPIICLTSYDSEDNQYIVWLYEAPDGDGEIPSENDLPDYEFLNEENEAGLDVRTFESEEAMLESYLRYIHRTNPSVLTGWNFEDFDASYLVNRLEKLDDESEKNLSPDRLSRINEVWSGGWGGPDIKGRVVLDLLEAYKRTQFTELESYRLDAVGEMELGANKERYEGDIGDLWENDPERLLEYNLRDVELCVELDKKQSIIPFWNEVRTFVGCKLEDAPIPGDACDMYVLHKMHGEYVLPSKGKFAGSDEEFEGGAVFEPTNGLVEDVSVLDLKSLYPMSMCSINASPDTKVENPKDYDDEELFRSPEIKKEDGSSFRVYFEKGEDGMIRGMVNELLNEREKKKSLRNEHDPDTKEYKTYDRQQASVKVVMNSLYGVLGWEQFRLYDAEMSAAVTAVGREVINFTETVSEELGYEVTYGDTDSVMLSLKDVGWDDLDKIPDGFKEEHPELITDDGDLKLTDEFRNTHPNMSDDELWNLLATIIKTFEIEEEINNRYDNFAAKELNADDHRFLIEAEKLYKRFLQAGKKKRYAGRILWKEGKHVDDIDITGFEYKRSDIAPVTKKVQKKVIKMLVTGESIDDVKEYLNETLQEFRPDGDITIEDVGIPGGLGQPLEEYDNPGAQPRGALYANEVLGTNFGEGSKPKRVYLEGVDRSFWTEYAEAEDELNLDVTSNETYRNFKKKPDVICYEYPDQVPPEFRVDWEKMRSKTLRGPISRVITAVGVTWDELNTDHGQAGLAQFM